MILHYLYVKEYGILKDVHFSFSDKYKIKYDPKEGILDIKENENRLPDDFFSIDTKRKVVDSVSAIIGNNGSGKTTVAMLFSALMSDITVGSCVIVFSLEETVNTTDVLYYYGVEEGNIKQSSKMVTLKQYRVREGGR